MEKSRNFYNSDILDKVKQLDKKEILLIDKVTPTHFLVGNEKIYVNLDLAYFTGGNIEIVDWKTGDGESNPLQFVVYAIYANEALSIPLGRISVIEYNLSGNQKIVHRFGPEKIEAGKDYITKSIGIMMGCLQDSTQNVASMADFPRTENEWRCDFCNFKKICLNLL